MSLPVRLYSTECVTGSVTALPEVTTTLPKVAPSFIQRHVRLSSGALVSQGFEQ